MCQTAAATQRDFSVQKIVNLCASNFWNFLREAKTEGLGTRRLNTPLQVELEVFGGIGTECSTIIVTLILRSSQVQSS